MEDDGSWFLLCWMMLGVPHGYLFPLHVSWNCSTWIALIVCVQVQVSLLIPKHQDKLNSEEWKKLNIHP
jgi:hypothetical protein